MSRPDGAADAATGSELLHDDDVQAEAGPGTRAQLHHPAGGGGGPGDRADPGLPSRALQGDQSIQNRKLDIDQFRSETDLMEAVNKGAPS